MGGACSRKRGQLDNEDNFHCGLSRRYSKSASSKWLATSFSRPACELQRGNQRCPSLMELCIQNIREVILLDAISTIKLPKLFSRHSDCYIFFLKQDIDKYSTFSMLPRDISQQIFNELVCSQRLTDNSLEAFRDCALQVISCKLLGKFLENLFHCFC